MDWYYASESDQRVSFKEEDFEALVSLGTIGSSTLVWSSGFSDWRKASAVRPTLFGMATKSPEMPPSFSGIASSNASGRSVFGIVSLWCGIVSLIFSCAYGLGLLPGLTAILLSRRAARSNSGEFAAEDGYGKTGRILGYAGTAMSAFFIVLLVVSLVLGIGPSGGGMFNSGPG